MSIKKCVFTAKIYLENSQWGSSGSRLFSAGCWEEVEHPVLLSITGPFYKCRNEEQNITAIQASPRTEKMTNCSTMNFYTENAQ